MYRYSCSKPARRTRRDARGGPESRTRRAPRRTRRRIRPCRDGTCEPSTVRALDRPRVRVARHAEHVVVLRAREVLHARPRVVLCVSPFAPRPPSRRLLLRRGGALRLPVAPFAVSGGHVRRRRRRAVGRGSGGVGGHDERPRWKTATDRSARELWLAVSPARRGVSPNLSTAKTRQGVSFPPRPLASPLESIDRENRKNFRAAFGDQNSRLRAPIETFYAEWVFRDYNGSLQKRF